MEETKFFISAVQSLAKCKYDMCSEDGTVKWKDDATDLPTDKQLETERKRLEEEYKSLAYSRSRKAEYPSIESLVVALYDTDDKSAIETKRAEIKKKYPKPE